MKSKAILLTIIILAFADNSLSNLLSKPHDLKIIIIRHGEKPDKGDNLTCKGLNRAMQLPAMITKKFGVPDFIYVPNMDQGKSTSHSRMFQTVMPLVIKYNMAVNSTHPQNDYQQIAEDVTNKSGTILMVWEHKAITPMAKAMGVDVSGLSWPDDDFDSIWIITFHKGVPTLVKDKEGLHPDDKCAF